MGDRVLMMVGPSRLGCVRRNGRGRLRGRERDHPVRRILEETYPIPKPCRRPRGAVLGVIVRGWRRN